MTFTIDGFCAYLPEGHGDPQAYSRAIRVTLMRFVADLVDKGFTVSTGAQVHLPDGSTFNLFQEADALRRGTIQAVRE